MKKYQRLLSFVLVIILCVFCLSTLIACNILGNPTKEKAGTKYYRYSGDERLDAIYILLANDGTWSDGRVGGTYTLEDTVLTFYDENGDLDEVGKLKYDIIFKDGFKYYKNSPSETDETNELTLSANDPALLAYYNIDDDGTTLIGLKTKYDDFTSIVIPDCITQIAHWAFEDYTALRSIVIPSNVQRIGEAAFCRCTSLTSVIFEEGLIEIEERAFESCSSLTTISLPDSLRTIGNSAFDFDYALENVDLGHGVERIGEYAFRHSGLRTIVVPDSIIRLEKEIFYDCQNLETIYFELASPGDWAFYWAYGNDAEHIWGYHPNQE